MDARRMQEYSQTGVLQPNDSGRYVAAAAAPETRTTASPIAGPDGSAIERGEADTETAGGTSGRRRRNSTAVGSIRI